MFQEFELLRASTADVPITLPWRRDKAIIDLVVEFAHQAHRGTRGNLTAIIGRNGTGKSHLLSAIAQTFILLEEASRGTRGKIRHLPLKQLIYRIDNKECVIERGPHGPQISVDGLATSIEDLPLPNRIIALTTSPFDKFTLPRSNAFSITPKFESRYRYLGLRDRTNRAAIETLLFRSLNSLFETKNNEGLRRANIGRVFKFLNLLPVIRVVYTLRVPQEVVRSLGQGRSLFDDGVVADSSRLKRTHDVLRDVSMSEKEFRHLLMDAISKADKGSLTLQADFGDNGVLDNSFIQMQPLRRAGFLRLRAVEVVHANGFVSDLKRASSGQLSMVAALLALASEIQNGSLVLIDEPELSLHPEWQVRYIDLLLQTFANFSGCHFVVATHSPMVISELPAHATVISLDSKAVPSAEELSGESADYLLAEAFGLPSNNNRYVKDRIVNALRLAADGETGSSEFSNEISHLAKFADDMSDEEPAHTVIQGLIDILEEQRGKRR